MADEEHVRRLKQGVDAWNAWRSDSLATRRVLRDADLSGANLRRADLSGAGLRGADLSGADLSGADLTGADLSGANLRGANLSGANLNHADLRDADLPRADLRDADLRDANLRDANLTGVDLRDANLTGVDLRDARLSGARLSGANLSGADLSSADLNSAGLRGADLSGAPLSGTTLNHADLSGANLSGADLSGAHLSGAHLSGADLNGADLSGANLNGADLSGANLRGANLRGANLTKVSLYETILANLDLTSVIGLDTCRHHGPSVIDHRTFQKFSRLPTLFLRGIGLPDGLIEYLPALFDQAIQYYSCFISYSTKDQDFAERIHADLQHTGVRCWFAPHDMPIGGKIIDEIDAAIRGRDKVLLILSEHSIKSDWVEDEVTRAFEEERKRGQTVLFPISLDDGMMATNEAWAATLRARHIGDFQCRKDHDAYKESFERVMRDLRPKTESPKTLG